MYSPDRQIYSVLLPVTVPHTNTLTKYIVGYYHTLNKHSIPATTTSYAGPHSHNILYNATSESSVNTSYIFPQPYERVYIINTLIPARTKFQTLGISNGGEQRRIKVLFSVLLMKLTEEKHHPDRCTRH